MPPLLGNELLRGDLVTLVRPTQEDIAIFASGSADVEYARMLRTGQVYPQIADEMESWFSRRSAL